MVLSAHELSERAIALVEHWSGGMRANHDDAHHVTSPAHGKLRAHARNRASKSLRWLQVPDPARGSIDAVVLIEFDAHDRVVAAWKLTPRELADAATSSTTARSGKRLLKIPVAGRWTKTATRIELEG